MSEQNTFDAIVVGGGFAGIYMLHRLRREGLSVRLLEAADGVGGVWYWNRYPGARCDVESADYSYSFDPELEQEWHWPERFSAQPEIMEYINHVADRLGLRPHIQLSTRVTSAVYQDDAGCWEVRTDQGDSVTTQLLFMATGCLSVARVPDYPGLERFRGEWFHTGEWPDEPVDLAGKRVGVIGVGSSGTQLIPVVAQEASQLFVFQRTPNFTVPAQNAPVDPAEEAQLKASYRERRAFTRRTASGLNRDMNRQSALGVSPDERARIYEEYWNGAGFGFILAFSDLMISEEANRTAVDFLNSKVRQTVRDPAVADLLCPEDYPFGAKRPSVDSGFHATFNRDHVTLVDIRRAPIEEITEKGLRTTDGEYELDVLVFATGFDAMTGAVSRIDLRGRDGRELKDKWAAGPRTYLGIATAGFPNLFFIAGAGSPSVLTNVIVSIEQHVEWLGDLVSHMVQDGIHTVEATQAAEDAWVDHVNETANATLYPQANSWYLGANVPGKPRVFMPYTGGLRAYRRKCAEVAAAGYDGFLLTGRIKLSSAATT
jgi:cation diffusion facilitator CzcD-associated flavoprotein CzcO